MIDLPERPHAAEVDEVLRALDVDPSDGLSHEESTARRETFGSNRLHDAGGESAARRLLRQFNNVLIHVLIAAAIVTFLLGHTVDAAVILGVVVINAAIGFFQEGKAERAIQAIREMLSPEARVRRSGSRRTVEAEALVPGDVVLLESGDRVPADLRLVETRELQIEEAALTGESVPVSKAIEPVPADADLGDRRSMAYAGTVVRSGRALGVVVATGERTEVGKVGEMVGGVRKLTTPLLRQLAGFGRALTVAILAVAALTLGIGVLVRGEPLGAMFLAAVALAVAAIPEGLPAILSITLAIGVQRMARRNAIIRHLPAVDTLGSVTVICSDKTGTLTRNEMVVTRVALPGERILEVTGEGYSDEGEIRDEDGRGRPDVPGENLERLITAGALCNDAELGERDGDAAPEGDPTEVALLVLARKAGIELDTLRRDHPRKDAIPFESERRFMATLHPEGEGTRIVVKGAPERVLEMCAREGVGEGKERRLDEDRWDGVFRRLADRGLRVLALAERRLDTRPERFDEESVEKEDLTLLGVVGIEDPPREEAIEAVEVCRSAGIRVKMITGDHAQTATAIAARMGIGSGDRALTGREIERMDDSELEDAVARTDVFARVSPEHKLRLIEALQARRQVVAMTGDGVNDAPALKRADVGVAMGIEGTEAAKEASDMVLADDNFASIERAVEEGRTVYDNLRKAVGFILPTNGGQALTVVAAVLLGFSLPITPVQILWVNMVTAVTLALALAFEPAEGDVMRRPPRDPGASILTRVLLWRIAWVSILLCAMAFGAFIIVRAMGGDLPLARTMAVNALVVGEAFYLVNARFLRASSLHPRSWWTNRYVLVAIAVIAVLQLLYTYLPLANTLFDTAPIPATAWVLLILAGIGLFLLVETEKAVLRAAERRRGGVGRERPAARDDHRGETREDE